MEVTLPPLAKRLFDDWYKNVDYEHRQARWDMVDPIAVSLAVKSIDSLFTRKPHGLFIVGNYGVGKTCLINLVQREYYRRLSLRHPTLETLLPYIGKEFFIKTEDDLYKYLSDGYWLAQFGRPFIIITHGKLLKTLRDHSSSHEGGQPLRKYILAIDDFARGFSDRSGWNVSLEFEFFNDRWRNRIPTFLTSSKTGAELREMADYGAIIDRLGDSSWITAVSYAGESKRKATER